ncbi:MAG: MFS transporter [Bacteroidetes bacterium]|nr:MFS transporter [Bacteroidota bacterium]
MLAPHSNSATPTTTTKAAKIAVVVVALGYFVDLFDLLLFGAVRIPSLRDLGYTTAEALQTEGGLLINAQMGGMLIGGVLWGIFGDRRGRKSVLFGSILMYSLANLANAFVHDVTLYAILRFIAGVGLAGELGAGVTLVSEMLPRDKRGVGTLVIAGFGTLGAATAGLVVEFMDWRTAYIVGGVMGLLLLLMRVGVLESGIFEKTVERDAAPRGAFQALFTNPDRLKRYLACIAVGLPIWFGIGLPVFFAPEFARVLGVQHADTIKASTAILFCYLGFSPGDVLSGLVSQRLQSRKKAMAIFMACLAAVLAVCFFSRGMTPAAYYACCFGFGFFGGYWAVFVTNASEQFGTNLRATVTTSVPNFVRGAVVPMTLSFEALKGPMGYIPAAATVGAVCFALAIWGLSVLPDRFHADLDYVEPL